MLLPSSVPARRRSPAITERRLGEVTRTAYTQGNRPVSRSNRMSTGARAKFPPVLGLLEDKPEGKLNQPRVIDGVIDDPKARWRVYVLLSTIAQAPHKKLRMVEQIEELSAELHTHSFAEREGKVLDDGEIGIHKSRTIDGRARSGAELACRRLLKSTRIKPILQGVNGGRSATGRIGCNRTWLVGIAHLVRTLQGKSVVGEVRSRFVRTVDDKQRESRCGSFD